MLNKLLIYVWQRVVGVAHWLEPVWQSLTVGEKVTTVVALVVGVPATVFGILAYIEIRRSGKRVLRSRVVNRGSVVELVEVRELETKLDLKTRLPGKLEAYVERECVRKALGDHLIPAQRRILFCGNSGAGKTREAIELIRRLESLRGRSVYLSRRTIPTPLDLPLVLGRNAILFIDDLVATAFTERTAAAEGFEPSDPADALEETANALKAATPGTDIDVIVTMQPSHFAQLQAELPGVTDQFQTVFLDKATLSERHDYILPTAGLFGLTFETESEIEKLQDLKGLTFGEIFRFFWVLTGKNIQTITDSEINSLLAERQRFWHREIYGLLDRYQRRVIDILSSFLAFGLETPVPTIIEACATTTMRWRWMARLRYRAALRRLTQATWLTIKKGRIGADESLLVSPVDDPKEKANQLQMLTETILTIKSRVPNVEYIRVASDLSTALYSNGLFENCARVTDLLLTIPAASEWDRALLYFKQGRAYEALGKTFWEKAASLYQQAISLETGNHFVEHSLASLYRRSGRVEEGRQILLSIVEQSPKDLTAHVALFQVEYECRDLRAACASYVSIRRLLRDPEVGTERGRAIARTKCAEFNWWYGQVLRERGDRRGAGRRFLKAVKAFDILLATFPSSRKQELAVLLNTYGCLLYDDLGNTDDAICKLKTALTAWPSHVHSLHKLATICLEQADQNPDKREEYLRDARELLHQLLKLNPRHAPAKLHLAILKSQEVDWKGIDEDQFWIEVSAIHDAFLGALEPEMPIHPSLHNAYAYHKSGCFLWQIEAVAHTRSFVEMRPEKLPTALEEFQNSLRVIENAADDSSLALIKHRILTWFFIGSYLISVSAKHDRTVYKQAEDYLRDAIELSASNGDCFSFWSQNSYVESTLARIFLERGDTQRAKDLCKSAISNWKYNRGAWKILGKIHNLENNWAEAIECYTTHAELKQSRTLLSKVLEMAQHWHRIGKISVHDLASVSRRVSKFGRGPDNRTSTSAG